MATWEMILMVFKEKVFVEEENLQDHQTRKKSKDKARDWKEKALHGEFARQTSDEDGSGIDF